MRNKMDESRNWSLESLLSKKINPIISEIRVITKNTISEAR